MFTRPAIGQLIPPPHLLLSAEMTQHHDAVWVFFLITLLAVTARLPNFLQQKVGSAISRE